MAVYLIICEGETDCWTLWNAGYPALGLPGASNVKCLQLAHVAGFERLIIVSEPDAAGAKFPAVIADHRPRRARRCAVHGYVGLQRPGGALG